VRGHQDGFRWFVEEINGDMEKIDYPTSRSQLAYLRMEHTKAFQNMTYNCKNSHAHEDAQRRAHTFVKAMSNEEEEMATNSSPSYRLEVVSDGCAVKDNQWHKTVFNMKPKDMEHLPIMDVAVFDVADEQEEFGLDIGPVCFQ